MTIAPTLKYLENSNIFDALNQIPTCLENRYQTLSMNIGPKSVQLNICIKSVALQIFSFFFIDS